MKAQGTSLCARDAQVLFSHVPGLLQGLSSSCFQASSAISNQKVAVFRAAGESGEGSGQTGSEVPANKVIFDKGRFYWALRALWQACVEI